MTFDAAVLGLGTMGTFACLELARRGVRVAGIDQFTPPHDLGSHSGDTRVFREAYAEHPDYVPLARHAGLLWDRLGREARTVFLERRGMLNLGPENSSLIAGIRASASAHGLRVDELSRAELRARYPAFSPPDGWTALFEPASGWIDVKAALEFGHHEAARAGAALRFDVKVESWEAAAGGFVVRTGAGEIRAKRLIVTAGAWAGRILSDLSLPLRILRKCLIWVRPERPEHFRPDVFPVFASADRFFYGFPDIGGAGVKLGIHWSGDAPEVNPERPQPEPGAGEIRPVLEAAAELLPSLGGPLPGAWNRLVRAKSCLYSMTPDEHFIIDRHPDLEGVFFAAGFSGHGFKFAPAVGQALADLATDGRTELPIGFLAMNRLQSGSGRGAG